MLIPGFWFNLQDNSFPLKGIRKTTEIEREEKIIHIVGISVTTISFPPPII
jgi:hypothetical protein